MYKSLFFFCCVALLSACSLASFDRYPGTIIEEVPELYRGYYKQVVPEKMLDKEDSTGLRIGKNWWEMERPELTERTYMGDSIVLSQYHGYYFVSVKNYDRKNWYIFVAEPNGKGLITVRPIVAQGKKLPLRKYMKRVNNTDGSNDFIYKMDEEQLLRYYSKVIKKHPGLEIKKISE